jgi:hypothetical protein
MTQHRGLKAASRGVSERISSVRLIAWVAATLSGGCGLAHVSVHTDSAVSDPEDTYMGSEGYFYGVFGTWVGIGRPPRSGAHLHSHVRHDMLAGCYNSMKQRDKPIIK